MKKITLVAATALAMGAMTLAGAAYADPATPDRLLNAGSDAEAGNWLMVHKTYDGHRYSTLDEINSDTIGDLKLAFAVPLGGNEPSGFGQGSLEGTPLAKDGMVYVSDPWGTPYKIDTTSGKRGQVVWVCDTGVEKDPNAGVLLANRGLALWGNLVITALSDGRMVACDDETGDVVWDAQVADNPGEGFSGAPLALPDKIIIGQSFGDWATRGFIEAVDPETGDQMWRFYTVPAPGEPGSDTWKCDETGNPDCWKTGGAAVWQTGSYDPDTDTLYYGTGNPVPMYDPEYRPGDNLYSNSSVALNADTGDMKWYFQYTPGDYQDYDEIGSQMLVDNSFKGDDRKMLVHFGRNGFLYSLDRTNGSFMNATQTVDKLDWTTGIDPKTGKPMTYDPSSDLQAYNPNAVPRRGGPQVSSCPHQQGGQNYEPSAYNPDTGIAYSAGIEGCTNFKVGDNDPDNIVPGQIFIGGDYSSPGAIGGAVMAYDVTTGEQVAKVDRAYPNFSGVLATPHLIFTGELDGTLVALDAKTLKQVWSVNLGAGIKAPPMTFESNGKQYIAVETGGPSSYGHPEIANMQFSNTVYFFAL